MPEKIKPTGGRVFYDGVYGEERPKSVKGNRCYIHSADRQEGFVVTDSPQRGAGRLLAMDGVWSSVGDVFAKFAGALNLIDKYCDQ